MRRQQAIWIACTFLRGPFDPSLMTHPEALVMRSDVVSYLEWTEAGIGEWRSIALSALEIDAPVPWHRETAPYPPSHDAFTPESSSHGQQRR